VYRGKVGDTYTIDHEAGELLAVVRTDRISAFDVILPRPIPHKGQVLSQMSAELLDDTASVARNWLLGSPDPNVNVGFKAMPFKIEMIVRGALLGTAWRHYQEGMRELCGNVLPDDMREFQIFDEPLLTPTTKAEAGHDENISPIEIIDTGLATADEFEEMDWMARKLYAAGQSAAGEKELLLADTKYEFGRVITGKIVLIDEVHTPDSSRYFALDQYLAQLEDPANPRPEQLSKEFVREWLMSQGFSGHDGQAAPEMPDDFVREVSGRYIDLYERMLGHSFEPAAAVNEAERLDLMRQRIVDYLGSLSVA
jgi:phosphoribosylaminoimidazole-succinocarboxamide synthase